MSTDQEIETPVRSPFNLCSTLPLAEDADHWICCLDENLTLCGKDGSNLNSRLWDADPVGCNLCQQAYEESLITGSCPLFPKISCDMIIDSKDNNENFDS